MSTDVPFSIQTEVTQFVALLRYHWRLIGITTMIGIVLAVVHLMVARKTYNATSRLLVLNQQHNDPIRWTSQGHAERTDDKDIMATQVGVIASRAICERAIKLVGIDKLPSLRKEEDPVDATLVKLSVTRPDRTARIIQIDYRSKDRAEAALFVQGVVDAYREFLLTDVYRNANQRVIELVTHSQGGLRSELEALQERYKAFRNTHSGLIIGPDGKPGRMPSAERLTQLIAAAGEVDARLTRFKAEFELSKQLAQRGGVLWAIAFAIGELGGGRDLPRTVDSRSDSDYLRSLIRERQQLVDIHGPQIAKAQELNVRINQLKEGSDVTELIATMDRVQHELEATKAVYDAKVSAALVQVRDDEMALFEESTLRDDLQRHRTLYNLVLDQMKQASLINDYSAVNFLVIDEPRTSKHPVTPKAKLELMFGCVAGSILGLVLAYRKRSLRRRVW